MKELGPVRFRDFGDRKQAESMHSFGRKLLGEMKQEMRAFGVEFLQRKVQLNSGIVFIVSSNMIGLAPIDEIQTFVPQNAVLDNIKKELHLLRGFIITISSELTNSSLVLKITDPTKLVALTSDSPNVEQDAECDWQGYPDNGSKHIDSTDEEYRYIAYHANYDEKTETSGTGSAVYELTPQAEDVSVHPDYGIDEVRFDYASTPKEGSYYEGLEPLLYSRMSRYGIYHDNGNDHTPGYPGYGGNDAAHYSYFNYEALKYLVEYNAYLTRMYEFKLDRIVSDADDQTKYVNIINDALTISGVYWVSSGFNWISDLLAIEFADKAVAPGKVALFGGVPEINYSVSDVKAEDFIDNWTAESESTSDSPAVVKDGIFFQNDNDTFEVSKTQVSGSASPNPSDNSHGAGGTGEFVLWLTSTSPGGVTGGAITQSYNRTPDVAREWTIDEELDEGRYMVEVFGAEEGEEYKIEIALFINSPDISLYRMKLNQDAFTENNSINMLVNVAVDNLSSLFSIK